MLLLSSEPYFWNREGNMADVLQAARPDTFNGFMLVGGRHIDYLQGGNPLIQLSEYLVAGFSQPQNIDAAQMISIPTTAGNATAVTLPLNPQEPSLLDELLNDAFNFVARNFFVYTPL